MRDKDNPNIEYKQISIPLVLLMILFMALVVMGLCFATLYLVTSAIAFSKGEVGPTLLIVLPIVDAFLLYSLVVNIISLIRVIKMEWEDKPTLYQILVFASLNFPCGIIMALNIKKQRDEKNK